MKLISTAFAGLLTVSLALSSCGSSGPSNSDTSIFESAKAKSGPVILKINTLEIHQGFLDLLVEINPRIKPQLDNPLTRRKILNSLIDQQLLFEESLKRNLNARTDIASKLLLNQHVIVANAVVEDELETAMKKAYEERKKTEFTKISVSLLAAHFNPNDEKAKPTDDQRKAALSKINDMVAKVKGGANFETVAKEQSDDKATNKKGGMAGQISIDDKRFARLGLKPVTEAAFKLKKDEISAPIETAKGYYVVKVTSDLEEVPYEEAKRVLQFELQNTLKKDLIDGLRKNAKIEFLSSEDAKPVPTAVQNPNSKSSPTSNLKAKVNIGAPVQKPQTPNDDHGGHQH